MEFSLATLKGPGTQGGTRIYLGDATYYGDADNGFAAASSARTTRRSAPRAWTTLSNPKPGTRGYASYNFCETQCSYDMVVEKPAGPPQRGLPVRVDELRRTAGVRWSREAPTAGRSMRSGDRGRYFTDMTNDGGAHPHGLHPDQHALVFVPGTAGGSHEKFFTGSDGGVVRTSGPWKNHSSDCGQRGVTGPVRDELRAVALGDPERQRHAEQGPGRPCSSSRSACRRPPVSSRAAPRTTGPGRATRDGFSETVGGDGGQSDFDHTNTDVRYHSYDGSTA